MDITEMKRYAMAFLFGLILTGCTSHQNMNMSEMKSESAHVQMAQASTTISNTLTDLGGMERAVTPPVAMASLPDPDSYNMHTMASVDWSGPVGPLVRQIADASQYQLRVLGTPPAIPVLVSINAKNTPLGYILRDIDFQCKSKANIVVFPERKVIELRYARS
jgi:defect-in-organelle-trafficking protein DotD